MGKENERERRKDVAEAAAYLTADSMKFFENLFMGSERNLEKILGDNWRSKYAESVGEDFCALAAQANYDSLTGLHIRRSWFDQAVQELVRAKRYNHPMSVLMMDIDHFKKVNDMYGHNCGDEVLQKAAQIFKKTSREIDIIGRYGGEEFVVILPNTNEENALLVAERIRERIANEPIPFNGQNVDLTISLGVALFREDDTLDKLVDRADTFLFQAKQAGRNQVWYQKGRFREVAE